jgi:hypothetical protein
VEGDSGDGSDKVLYPQIYRRAHDNREKLNACDRHLFDTPFPIPVPFGTKLSCSRCGGRMAADAVFEYINGYKAAGGDPNDVIPGYTDEPS